MVSCRKNGGKIWNPVSSCNVSAWLKLGDQVVAASARRNHNHCIQVAVGDFNARVGCAERIYP